MIRDLISLKEFFKNCVKTPIFGVGVYAFDRVGLEDIVLNYRLLSLRYSLDTKIIEKTIDVFSLEKGMGTKHINMPRNSTTVLTHPRTKEYLSKFETPALIVYKSSSKVERVCRENNWTLVATPVKFGKALFEDKIKFRKILEEIGAQPPPGEVILARNLDFYTLENKYGLPFVLQHPRRGGGKGTFFIKSQEDWRNAIKKLSVHEKEGEEIAEDISRLEVIVAKYIKGPSPSITGCVTRHGILSTRPQYQLIDIPQLYNPQKGSGLFCGHDWSSSGFPEHALNQAYNFVEKVGNCFKLLGYRGIFGIDFVLDENTQELYITECNPRLLGSFPTLTMAQLANNEPPIIAFHLLEHLNMDYEMDVKSINNLMRQPKRGAQMFLHNLTGSWARSSKTVKAGVYKLRKRKFSIFTFQFSNKYDLIFLRRGYLLKHIKHRGEFLLTNGVLQEKSFYSPNRRLCRIITKRRVLRKDKKTLTPWARRVAETVHESFGLKKIHFVKLIKLFNPDYLAKG